MPKGIKALWPRLVTSTRRVVGICTATLWRVHERADESCGIRKSDVASASSPPTTWTTTTIYTERATCGFRQENKDDRGPATTWNFARTSRGVLLLLYVIRESPTTSCPEQLNAAHSGAAGARAKGFFERSRSRNQTTRA